MVVKTSEHSEKNSCKCALEYVFVVQMLPNYFTEKENCKPEHSRNLDN